MEGLSPLSLSLSLSLSADAWHNSADFSFRYLTLSSIISLHFGLHYPAVYTSIVTAPIGLYQRSLWCSAALIIVVGEMENGWGWVSYPNPVGALIELRVQRGRQAAFAGTKSREARGTRQVELGQTAQGRTVVILLQHSPVCRMTCL